jgi:hypothetical protein
MVRRGFVGLSVRLLGGDDNPGLRLLFLRFGKKDEVVEVFASKTKPGLAI